MHEDNLKRYDRLERALIATGNEADARRLRLARRRARPFQSADMRAFPTSRSGGGI